MYFFFCLYFFLFLVGGGLGESPDVSCDVTAPPPPSLPQVGGGGGVRWHKHNSQPLVSSMVKYKYITSFLFLFFKVQGRGVQCILLGVLKDKEIYIFFPISSERSSTIPTE